MRHIHTLIIGAGQAGLGASWHLLQRGVEHIILEKSDRAGAAWRDQRWDSFALNSPRWASALPGDPYSGDDPEELLPRLRVLDYFDVYVKKFAFPIQYRICVTAVEPLEGRGWLVTTDSGAWRADNVVIATGLFQSPKFPAFAAQIAPRVAQVHSSAYRSPAALPEGAVLVVGASQSGMQIAEDLHTAGRRVYLSTGQAPRAPRRYRGRDVFGWLKPAGFFDRTPDMLPSPRLRFAGNPQVSNRRDGPPVNLHYFSREGMQLLGRLTGGSGERLSFADDLPANLTRADQGEADLVKMMDGYIAAHGIEAPAERLPEYTDGYTVKPLRQLDLAAQGVSAILWANGFGFDFSMVKVPVTDEFGYPIAPRGVTQFPGLYFIGMPWLSKFQSGLLIGVNEDAEYLAEKIAA